MEREADSLDGIRRLYEALGRADLDALKQVLSADAVVRFAGASALVPWHGGARGPDEIAAYLRSLAMHLVFEKFEVLGRVVGAEHAALRIHVRYRVKLTGRVVDQLQVHWLTFEAGRITSLEHFEDTALVQWAASQASHTRGGSSASGSPSVAEGEPS